MAETDGCGARPPSDRSTLYAQAIRENVRLREEVDRLAPAKDHLEAQLTDALRGQAQAIEMLRREARERQRIEILLAATLGELQQRREGKVPEPMTPAKRREAAPEDIPLPAKPPATEPAPTPSGPLEDCAAKSWEEMSLNDFLSRNVAGRLMAQRFLGTIHEPTIRIIHPEKSRS